MAESTTINNNNERNVNNNNNNAAEVVNLEEVPKSSFWGIFKKKYELLNYEQLPDYMKFNRFIITGYRPQLPLIQTLLSLMHNHNETLNVWTHLIGALIFTVLMIVAYSSWLLEGSFFDFSVFTIFILSAQLLLLASSSFHLLQVTAKNHKEYTLLAKLDYIGISVLIVGSYYAPIYYLFYCEPLVAMYYTGVVTVLAAIAISLTFLPLFDRPGYELHRASVFMLMGWIGTIAGIHALFLFGITPLLPLLWRMALMGFLYSIGVVFYVSRIPEKWWPGKFDYGFSSHVIWHIFVIAATIMTYKICTYCYENRYNLPCLALTGTLPM